MRKISFLRGVKIVTPWWAAFFPTVERLYVWTFAHKLGGSWFIKFSTLVDGFLPHGGTIRC